MDALLNNDLERVGKIGNKVYYYWRGRRYYRSYFKPVQPGTPAQLAWWTVFREGVLAWQGLTDPQKEAYNKEAKDKRLVMSGFNLFMSRHLDA